MLDMEEIQPETSLKPRILVADDHFLIAETLSILLAPHFDVVGVVNDAKLVADEVARLRPEVVLLDVTMPGLNGLDAARMILEQAPNTKIVFLTMHANRVIVKEAFRAGASAFVVKNCAANDLVLAVRTVLTGGTYVSPEVQEDGAQAPSEELSERQITYCASLRRDAAPSRSLSTSTSRLARPSSTRTRSWRNSNSAPLRNSRVTRSSTASGRRVPLTGEGSTVRDFATDNTRYRAVSYTASSTLRWVDADH